ncbi:MAG: FAD-dependent thymidylate synthase [Oscillospiraceae bacterium]|jgi:thymidylate synthase (FAD)|nr:FAD-dependent thymidylate synthase [Oscillospiraceae bacterium]
MRVIKPCVYLNPAEISKEKLTNIERAARVCYKSEEKMGVKPSSDFLKGIISRGHESVIEHEKITVYFVVDRGVSHEIVRHRIASYSQESTRYCNYTSEKFGNEITVVEPYFYSDDEKKYKIWEKACLTAENSYIELVKTGSPQEARAVLPNSLKTEIAVTFNFREWRHFFKLRCSKEAHPQIQQAAIPLLLRFKEKLPPIFDGIGYNENFPVQHYAEIKMSDPF